MTMRDKDGGRLAIAAERSPCAVGVEFIRNKKPNAVAGALVRVVLSLKDSSLAITVDKGGCSRVT